MTETEDEMRFAAALNRQALSFKAGSSDALGADAKIMYRGDHVGSIVLSTLPNRAVVLFVFGRDDIQVGAQSHAFYHAMLNVADLIPGSFVNYTSFADWIESIGHNINDLMSCEDACKVCGT